MRMMRRRWCAERTDQLHHFPVLLVEQSAGGPADEPQR
jgi:hypothetical protein